MAGWERHQTKSDTKMVLCSSRDRTRIRTVSVTRRSKGRPGVGERATDASEMPDETNNTHPVMEKIPVSV